MTDENSQMVTGGAAVRLEAIFDLDDGPVEEVVFVEAPEDTTDW